MNIQLEKLLARIQPAKCKARQENHGENQDIEEKGMKDGKCNVTHCQKPHSAKFYNTATYAWYCRECAERIERAAMADGLSFFPGLHEKKN